MVRIILPSIILIRQSHLVYPDMNQSRFVYGNCLSSCHCPNIIYRVIIYEQTHVFEFERERSHWERPSWFGAPRSFSLKGVILPDATTRSRYRSNQSAQKPCPSVTLSPDWPEVIGSRFVIKIIYKRQVQRFLEIWFR